MRGRWLIWHHWWKWSRVSFWMFAPLVTKVHGLDCSCTIHGMPPYGICTTPASVPWFTSSGGMIYRQCIRPPDSYVQDCFWIFWGILYGHRRWWISCWIQSSIGHGHQTWSQIQQLQNTRAWTGWPFLFSMGQDTPATLHKPYSWSWLHQDSMSSNRGDGQVRWHLWVWLSHWRCERVGGAAYRSYSWPSSARGVYGSSIPAWVGTAWSRSRTLRKLLCTSPPMTNIPALSWQKLKWWASPCSLGKREDAWTPWVRFSDRKHSCHAWMQPGSFDGSSDASTKSQERDRVQPTTSKKFGNTPSSLARLWKYQFSDIGLPANRYDSGCENDKEFECGTQGQHHRVLWHWISHCPRGFTKHFPMFCKLHQISTVRCVAGTPCFVTSSFWTWRILIWRRIPQLSHSIQFGAQETDQEQRPHYHAEAAHGCHQRR